MRRDRRAVGRIVALALATSAGATCSRAAWAATRYWDVNGSNPEATDDPLGFADGTWDTSATNWNAVADGTGASVAFAAGDSAVFSAGANAVDCLVTVSGTQVAASVLVEEGAITQIGGVVDTGTGSLTINSGASWSIATQTQFNAGGRVVLNGGTLRSTNPGNGLSFVNVAKTLEINGSGTVAYDDGSGANNFATIYQGTIIGTGGTAGGGGAGTLIKTGVDEFRVQGANMANNTFAKLVVNQGLYRIGNVTGNNHETAFGAVPTATLSDAITLNNGGRIGASASITLHSNRGITIGSGGGGFTGIGSVTLTVPGPLTGSGNLSLTGGGGVLALTNPANSNTYSGSFQVTASTLAFPADTALGAVPASPDSDFFTLGSSSPTPTTGTLSPTASMTLHANRGINLAGSGVLAASSAGVICTYNGVIDGFGNLTKSGAGTWVLGGNNNYFGTTTISGGVLSISSESNLGSDDIVFSSGGTLRGTGNIAPGASRDIILTGAGTIEVGGGTTFTAAGAVSGAGALTMSGSGTLIISGSGNTYSGATVVNAGQLTFNVAGSYGSTASIRVNAGGAVALASGSLSGAFLAKVQAATSNSTGALLLAPATADATSNIDFAAGNMSHARTAEMSIGALGAVTYTGTITPNALLGYRLGGGIGGGGGGTLTLANVNALTGAHAVTVVSGGTVVLAASNSYSGATNVNGGRLVVADGGGANRVLQSGAVSVTAGGTLDLKDNKLITTSARGTASGGVYNGVQGLVQQASNAGAWDGAGLTTSMPDAVAGLTSIGVATGEQILGLGPTDTALFAGQPITGASTVAMYTYAGDANLDGFISGDDYASIDGNVSVPGADGWYNGDFNYDGIISGDDYAFIDSNIVAQGAPFPIVAAANTSGVATVPEPAAVGTMMIVWLAVASGRRETRRRRSRR